MDMVLQMQYVPRSMSYGQLEGPERSPLFHCCVDRFTPLSSFTALLSIRRNSSQCAELPCGIVKLLFLFSSPPGPP